MQLHYREFGEGKPLIILHGLFGMSDNWVTLGKKFAQNFKVYIPDHRNHGKSPHSPQLNYFSLAEDLSEFIDEHKIECPIILGHSMGGKTAMLYALENPDNVKKLIIADISPSPYELHHVDMIYAMLNLNFDLVKSRQDVDKHLAQVIKSEKVRQIAMKNLYWVDKKRLGWRLNIEAIHNNIDAIVEGIEANLMYDKPTLFIKGGLSDYINESRDFPRIEQLFPCSKIETIEHATHWLHAEAPDKFYELVINFLQS